MRDDRGIRVSRDIGLEFEGRCVCVAGADVAGLQLLELLLLAEFVGHREIPVGFGVESDGAFEVTLVLKVFAVLRRLVVVGCLLRELLKSINLFTSGETFAPI